MFRKMRNKILLLNMVMVSAVVIVAFAVILATTYTRMQNDNREKLLNGSIAHLSFSTSSGLTIRGNTQRAEPIPDGVQVSGIATRISPDTGLSFSLFVDSQARLTDVNSMVNLQDETYELAAAQAIAFDGSAGMTTLEGRKWQFSIAPVKVFLRDTNTSNASFEIDEDSELRHIRFLDVTDSYKMIQSLALMLIGLTVVLLAVFFFISRYFANRAILPMEEAWESQTRFIADASHELKTPLSVINANCGVLYGNKNESVESQLKWVDSIMRAACRMTDLVSSLLSLASMEDVQLSMQNVPFNFSTEAVDVVSELEASAFEKGLVIQKEIEENIEIESDREQVRKILCILLDNAVKYTERGERITVSLLQEKRSIICSVRNSGAGIPPEDIPHLFDRFYRRDPSRSSDNGGYGLGLAIAQAIAKQLGATLVADSVLSKYTEFQLIFYKQTK